MLSSTRPIETGAIETGTWQLRLGALAVRATFKYGERNRRYFSGRLRWPTAC
jgi:hypothetical protein